MALIKSNIHTHTTFCDGKDRMEDMVKAAIAVGFDTLGLSFHSYTSFDPSYCIRDYLAYMKEFGRLKREYAGKICLLNGVELDLYGERPSVCDYVIGSVHYFKAGERHFPVDCRAPAFVKIINNVFGGDVYAAAELFYREVGELSEKVAPDVYGHFDVITCSNAEHGLIDEGNPRYRRAALSAVQKLPQGAVIEVNLGRLFRGNGGMYPSPWLLQEMCARGCRFMLSSDAHCKEALGFMFDETCAELKKLGVKSLVRYKGAEFEEAEL